MLLKHFAVLLDHDDSGNMVEKVVTKKKEDREAENFIARKGRDVDDVLMCCSLQDS
jgi:hypothetical protein